MNDALLGARLILSAVFLVAGLAKLLDRSGSAASLAGFGVPASFRRPLGVLLPVGELACGLALIPVSTAWWGAIGAMALLLAFSSAIAISLALGRKPDCHCFGQLHSAPVGWPTLGRNLGLAAIALFVVIEGRVQAGASLTQALGGVRGSGSMIAFVLLALVGLGAFQLAALVHVLRQNGRLLLRIEALEARSGADVKPAAGLPVGDVAPAFSLTTIDGGTMTLDRLRERGQPLLLLFSDAGCAACDAMLPDVAAWQREQAGRVSIVPIMAGEERQHRVKVDKLRLVDVLLQPDRRTSQTYKVEVTPSAVLIRDGRIGSSVAAGAEAIRALLLSSTQPSPLQRGDLVPSLRLTDLSGRTMDLARLEGRRTLLLFWNPTCGFCQSMLEEVKAWERRPPADAPALLVVSAGSPESNRVQGFRARVLLDQQFSAGNTLGASGTPSGVLIDEAGRIASDVAVGSHAVMFLAGALPAEASAPS